MNAYQRAYIERLPESAAEYARAWSVGRTELPRNGMTVTEMKSIRQAMENLVEFDVVRPENLTTEQP